MEAIFFLAILLLIMAGYYSLVVMPKQHDFKKHQSYVSTLNVGDEVITHGGLIGTITELDVEVGIVRITIAEGVEVRIITAAVLQQYIPQEIERNAKIGLGIQESSE